MKVILLIEDSVDIRETTAEILELANYKVFTAENGKTGVELALKTKPDLVICDIMMPVLDGYGVLHIFSQNPVLRNTPFIFLTAKTERSDLRKGMEMGADDYLTKPFQEIDLLNAIESRLKKFENITGSFKNTTDDLEKLYHEAFQGFDLESLSLDRKVSSVRKKQIIYTEGDEPNKVFFLKTGKVKTYQSNRDGKEFVTGLYNAGDFFGYISLIEGSVYQESAESLEDSEIVGIPKNEFLDLITGNQTVANKFIKMLANDILEKEKQLTQMAYSSLRKRTADALILLMKKYKTENQNKFSIRISRDDLASVIGTATESLIRTISDFKSEKLVEVNGGEITILDEEKLANLRS
ncbi:cAMP-binding domain of CRP or a regulatory subunit of cAMP-dependent protein kinases [Pseudarcicella hirudinis]|uniref:cAMP-binding domain of CRP or a regulatory subunit of cAMP-dependent protein kinases n=1 Tax=Pseudarcicella hirudinis TaxID=1079859 RepID=A0A1I5TMD1_9BACT|nr:response regulator [Pseudarcicella hirudinis]SFP84205.1 cAMP-binding domain of CRP or a regulatory subunit of cAMP-dependent protein kinases [Pseudarcicella hirudinis]